jgi:hypothetical protein
LIISAIGTGKCLHWKPPGFLPNHPHAPAGTPAFSSLTANQAGEPRWGLNE